MKLNNDILENYQITKIDNTSVKINNDYFYYSYNVIKSETGQLSFVEDLQCHYLEDSDEYKSLEIYLSFLAIEVLDLNKYYVFTDGYDDNVDGFVQLSNQFDLYKDAEKFTNVFPNKNTYVFKLIK